MKEGNDRPRSGRPEGFRVKGLGFRVWGLGFTPRADPSFPDPQPTSLHPPPPRPLTERSPPSRFTGPRCRGSMAASSHQRGGGGSRAYSTQAPRTAFCPRSLQRSSRSLAAAPHGSGTPPRCSKADGSVRAAGGAVAVTRWVPHQPPPSCRMLQASTNSLGGLNCRSCGRGLRRRGPVSPRGLV